MRRALRPVAATGRSPVCQGYMRHPGSPNPRRSVSRAPPPADRRNSAAILLRQSQGEAAHKPRQRRPLLLPPKPPVRLATRRLHGPFDRYRSRATHEQFRSSEPRARHMSALRLRAQEWRGGPAIFVHNGQEDLRRRQRRGVGCRRPLAAISLQFDKPVPSLIHLARRRLAFLFWRAWAASERQHRFARTRFR